MANRRTQKTKREIKGAFLALLSKNSLEKVKVTEIIELAEVSRATFYLHFEDIYAVYDSVKEDILNEFSNILIKEKSINSKEFMLEKIKFCVDFTSVNKHTLGLMINNGNLLSEVHKHIFSLLLDEFYPQEQPDFGKIEVNFVLWGISGTIIDWLTNKLDVSEETLIETIMYSISRFVEFED